MQPFSVLSSAISRIGGKDSRINGCPRILEFRGVLPGNGTITGAGLARRLEVAAFG